MTQFKEKALTTLPYDHEMTVVLDSFTGGRCVGRMSQGNDGSSLCSHCRSDTDLAVVY